MKGAGKECSTAPGKEGGKLEGEAKGRGNTDATRCRGGGLPDGHVDMAEVGAGRGEKVET